jgi:hypothetical protein
MKRPARIVLLILMAVLLAGSLPRPAAALTPYRTWALGPGGQLYLTQDAYIPLTEIELPINAAEDLFITADGQIYIADTGNGRILRVQGEQVTGEFGKGLLEKPTGVFVDEDGVIYVADAGNARVVKFTKTGEYVSQYRAYDDAFADLRSVFVDEEETLCVSSAGRASRSSGGGPSSCRANWWWMPARTST